ncbi:hypothetical protein Droror1_Dr00000107 [Drosera rotundifolia]
MHMEVLFLIDHQSKLIYSRNIDRIMRCWDLKHAHEVYRITVGFGGLGSGFELHVWSLLALSCGTLVSADTTGSVGESSTSCTAILEAYGHELRGLGAVVEWLLLCLELLSDRI